MQRMGIPREAIQSSVRTLQKIQHHIQMAYGDLVQTYTRPQDKPLKELGQGYGIALAEWHHISTPLINMMKH